MSRIFSSFSRMSDVRIALCIAAIVACVYIAGYTTLVSIAESNGADIPQLVTAGDSSDYIAIAHSLLESGRFALSSEYPLEFFRFPAYPVFLAGLFWLGFPLGAVPVFQALLSGFAAALIYLLGVRFVSRSVAAIAAGLYAIEPMIFMHSVYLLTEAMFVLVLLAAIYVAGTKWNRWLIAAFCGGALFGLAALTRPLGFYLLPLIALMAGVTHWPDRRRVALAVAVFTATALLTVFPWALRNKIEGGHFDLSSIRTYNLLFYNLTGFVAEQDGVSFMQAREGIAHRVGTDDWFAQRSFEYIEEEKRVVSEILDGNVLSYAVYHIYRTIPFFVGTSIGSMQLMLHNQGVLAGQLPTDMDMTAALRAGAWGDVVRELVRTMPQTFERVAWLVLMVAALSAVWWHGRKEGFISWITLAFLLIGACAILSGPVSNPRFRVPAEPFIFLLGVQGLYLLAASLMRRIRS